MTSLDKLPVARSAEPPGHADAVASLRAGNPFTCVLSDNAAERSALLQAVIDTEADMDTRFVQVGNPLRAPLTIERVFMQAVGPEADVRFERDGAALTRILAGPVGDETRLIVVIEQAETLDPETLNLLREMAPSFASVQPHVQVLFAAPDAFAAALQPPPAPEPQPLPSPPAAPLRLVPAEAPEAPRRRRAPRVMAILLAAVAGAGVLAWQREPELLRRLGLPIPVSTAPVVPRAEAAPPPIAPAPLPATVAPSPAADDTAALRQEFDRFLAERPGAAGLSEAGREALFQEFLLRRRARPTAP